jgi:hypothetical protein
MQGLSLGSEADKKALIEEVKTKVDVYKKVVQRSVSLALAWSLGCISAMHELTPPSSLLMLPTSS